MNLRLSVLISGIIPILTCFSCSEPVESFEYASGFYRIQLIDSVPFVRYFSVDALGQGKLDHNPVLWDTPAHSGDYELRKISGSKVKICSKEGSVKIQWLLKFEERQFTRYYPRIKEWMDAQMKRDYAKKEV